VFGFNRKRTGIRFEKAVERFGKRGKGRIDVFWPGTLLTAHKGADQDLDAAHTQATNYFDGLSDSELPRYMFVSDFQRFRLYNLEDNTAIEFKRSELPSRILLFGFIAGYSKIKVRDEDPLNIKAVQLLGDLHDALKKDGYGLDENDKAGHVLQMSLVHVVFCLFADNTGTLIAKLFQVLNTSREKRQRSLEEEFSPSPYIDGRLFEEALRFRNSAGKCAGFRSIAVSCGGQTSRPSSSAPCFRRSSS